MFRGAHFPSHGKSAGFRRIAARGFPLLAGLFAICTLTAPIVGAQAPSRADPSEPSYGLRVSVDEVGLSFHAADANGLPVNDLRVDELKLLDNGRPPLKILDFYTLKDAPIRAAILIDTSSSMAQALPASRAIAIQYARQILRQKTDQAFVMEFGYVSNLALPWTSDPAALAAALGNVRAGRQNPLGGTAVFDTVFRACFNLIGKIDHAAGGNFILLFSDGEDNASHTTIAEAVDMCQRSHTAVYAFQPPPGSSGLSTGPGKLSDLARQSGGRVFLQDEPQAALINDLRLIESDLRNQYRVVYKPARLQHDGTFHHIELSGPDRAASITVRSGYYAPRQ